MFFARLYRDFADSMGYNLYGTKLLKLPYPQYIIFYNGTAKRPEREILKLSDSFKSPVGLKGEQPQPSLECRALVLNINYGHNEELMNKCKPLLDYSKFVHYIRENMAEGYRTDAAADRAVERCISEDVLADVLRAHRKEVVSMFLEEYGFWKNSCPFPAPLLYCDI